MVDLCVPYISLCQIWALTLGINSGQKINLGNFFYLKWIFFTKRKKNDLPPRKSDGRPINDQITRVAQRTATFFLLTSNKNSFLFCVNVVYANRGCQHLRYNDDKKKYMITFSNYIK
jgi:hypothetical protein